MKNEFDLIVIGGGSGGLASAQRAAEYGKNVALIEKAPLGGTCVNVGCVPKKIMWYASHLTHQMEIAEDYGFNFSPVTHEWKPLKKRRDEYIKRLNLIYENNLNKREITLIKGEARLEDKHTVCVSDESFKTEHIIIATGGQPTIPDITGANYGITSDGFFELEEKPKNVCIVGSGYIAVEFAGMLSALGTNVTMNIRTESILRSFDSMLSKNLKEIMTHHDIKIQTGKIPESIESDGSKFILKTTDGEESELYDTITM